MDPRICCWIQNYKLKDLLLDPNPHDLKNVVERSVVRPKICRRRIHHVYRASNICSVGFSPDIVKLNLTIEIVARGEMTTRSKVN